MTTPYTLLFMTNSLVVNAATKNNLPFDSEKDFQPISLVGDFPNVLAVHPSVQAKTLKELITLAERDPLFYASSGAGNLLATELFLDTTGLKAERIPYKGAGAAIPAVLGGEVAMMLTGVINALPHLNAGTLRPIVVTSKERVKQLPDVPSIVEEGFPVSSDAVWYGMLAPAGIPEEALNKVHSALMEAMSDPVLRGKLEELTLRIETNSPQEYAEMISADIKRWRDVLSEKKIKLEE